MFLWARPPVKLTGKSPDSENSQALMTVIVDAFKSEFQKFLYFIFRALPLLLLFVIPMVNVAAPLIWFLFSAWMLAIEYSDYPMGNHEILFKRQREQLAANRPVAFGFGVGVMVLTMLPIINFLAMPVAVAGATRMVVEHSGFET